MSDFRKKVLLGIVAIVIITGGFIYLEKKQSEKANETYTPPPVEGIPRPKKR